MDNLKLENQLCFPIYLTAKELTRVYDKLNKPEDEKEKDKEKDKKKDN